VAKTKILEAMVGIDEKEHILCELLQPTPKPSDNPQGNN
jgi:hypothetical protein